MKTLDKISIEVAESYGMTWEQVALDRTLFNATVEKVAKTYAEQAIREAAERASAYLGFDDSPTVSKQSILNLINELK